MAYLSVMMGPAGDFLLLFFFFFLSSFSFLMSLLRVGNWPRAWTLDEYNEITPNTSHFLR